MSYNGPEADDAGYIEVGEVTEDIAWTGWRVTATGPWNALDGAKMYIQTRDPVRLSPAQWADVYYFARAADLPEFLARAQEVFEKGKENG
jgi:hypothetical protein